MDNEAIVFGGIAACGGQIFVKPLLSEVERFLTPNCLECPIRRKLTDWVIKVRCNYEWHVGQGTVHIDICQQRIAFCPNMSGAPCKKKAVTNKTSKCPSLTTS